MLWHEPERCCVYSWHQKLDHTCVLTEELSTSKDSQWICFTFLKQQLLNVHLSGPVDRLTKYLCSLSSQFVFLHTLRILAWSWPHYGSNILLDGQVVSFYCSPSSLLRPSSIKDKYSCQFELTFSSTLTGFPFPVCGAWVVTSRDLGPRSCNDPSVITPIPHSESPVTSLTSDLAFLTLFRARGVRRDHS